jgi:hypothetical protein
MNFSNWNENEPNDHRKNEDCVEMQFDSGKWNDVGCNWVIFSTVCEKFLDNDGEKALGLCVLCPNSVCPN